MQAFPHHYSVSASARRIGDVAVEGEDLPTIQSAPPTAFGGPGDRWSPETLLVAAVADCFVLTFRAIAEASHLPWISLTCDAEGTLDRIDRVTQFTEVTIRVRLQLPPDGDEQQALRLLTKAEQNCLVTNSLKASAHLDAVVDVEVAAS